MRRYAEAVIRFRMHVIAVTLAVTTLLGAQVRHLRVVINPDAHSTGGLDNLEFGIGQARRAGLRAEDVFNTREGRAVAERLGKARGL